MSFLNKVVLVTGASLGIGAAIAQLFAKEAAHVAMVGRNEERLRKVHEQCAKVGPKPLAIVADITNEDDVKRIVKTTRDTFEKVDVLVNNAGICKYGTILGGDVIDTYNIINNTNVRAAVHLTSLLAPYLVKSNGSIVNISSGAGIHTPPPLLLAYGLSKAAMSHFTRAAALELAPSGVRVNTVTPGPVKTDVNPNPAIWHRLGEQTALGRYSEPEEIADLVLFLSSDKAKGITGANFVCDNGLSLKGLVEINKTE